MALGAGVRAIAGPRLFRVLGNWYRRVFVDLNELVTLLAGGTPQGAHVLDIGGGDGAPINALVAKRADLTVTMIDIGDSVGTWIEDRFSDRVIRQPKTSLAEYLQTNSRLPDVVFLLDVIHHVPAWRRVSLYAELGILFKRRPDLRVFIKDVEPGHWRSRLGLWSDRYVTGDRHVEFVTRVQLLNDLRNALGPIRDRETPLFERDAPNYMLEIELHAAN
jgi:Methyltransferase domain